MGKSVNQELVAELIKLLTKSPGMTAREVCKGLTLAVTKTDVNRALYFQKSTFYSVGDKKDGPPKWFLVGGGHNLDAESSEELDRDHTPPENFDPVNFLD